MFNILKYFDCLIFDFDKTIATIPINWTIERINFISFANKNFNISFKNNLRVDQMEYKLIEIYPSKVNNILSFRRSLESSLISYSVPNKSITDSIKKFDKDMFIISNNLTGTITHILEDLNILKKFTKIIGIDTYYSPKPSTMSWEKLCQNYSFSLDKTLFIGDSPETDGQFARSIGINYFQIPSNDDR
jgi:HAD superfamily hydrolase (TIGR01549 family)